MTTTDSVFVGSIPAYYEKFLVPMIFEPYARDIAERLRQLDPADVLEVATGTGVLTRAMASALGGDVRITASDLNQPMLDIAMEKQGAGNRITWKQADGQALPFADQAFDAVACQFGVMFFPDKVKGYSEARRVLRPGGRYIFSVWDKLENNEFVTVLSQALAEMFPADPPHFMERMPHGYWNLQTIGDELKAADFSSLSVETVDHVSHAASTLDAVTGYCMGSPLGNDIELRAPGELASVTRTVAKALEKRFGQGPIEGKIRAHIVTAVR
ncbi:MAG: SAM-dependent methyltransferase [Rhizobium sp.]|nr:SAM-dependent methyltransferase [Rhizobium sp.]